ncbi:hypothetical protein KMZ68_06310 [Bradyrhizobium sediminis]|uniref:Uncharacterized protein n=1 Tax=Bradyrhizobium sediminis TaxID=2840469 RepID=A0A975RU48_9BRAD|nr:hypothetical protein [Bradyrhizobium sediminis]QWG19456.1 hypothetical protein KMZ68_06310 [Bradyrhizobium sediminis]
MTLLTHSNGPFESATYSSGARSTAGTSAAEAHLTMIKRFCIGALATLAIGGAASAVVALRAALYFSRHHF